VRALRNLLFLLIDRTRSAERQWPFVMPALIGVLGALSTIGFREALFFAERVAFGPHYGLVDIASGLPRWERLLVPALGGVCAGLVLVWARRVAAQSASSDYMEAIALGDGNLGVRFSLLRALSSWFSVVSGGAIGREGSMVQLAALAGSIVGRWRRVPIPKRRLLVACGAAAGVATAYNAPIAGALFVAEIVLHSVAFESLGPLIVAAVAATLTTTQLFGVEPVYRMPELTAPDGTTTIVLALLGLIAGLGAPLYRAVLDLGRHGFARWKAPLWLKLGAGGLIVGALSVVSPDVWGNGYSVVNSVLRGGWVWQMLLLVLVLKVIAVAATTGSGAVGGIFTPTLFVGAVIGALFSAVVQVAWPGHLQEAVAVGIGMGAFLSACTHAPLMSILMVFEMTGNYGLIVPLMLACVLSYTVSRLIRVDSIYSEAAGAALPPPAITTAIDLVQTDSATIRSGSSLDELEQTFLRFRRPHVYVLDATGRFLGAISIHDAAPLLKQGRGAGEGWPGTLVRADFPAVRTDAPVWQVLETFATHAGERLPVLDAQGLLKGYVTKSDLMLMFRERLARPG
jgi:CIC family chloride channel protein